MHCVYLGSSAMVLIKQRYFPRVLKPGVLYVLPIPLLSISGPSSTGFRLCVREVTPSAELVG